MTNPKHSDNKQDSSETEDAKAIARAKVERLCKCDRILSETDTEVAEFGDITKFVEDDGIVYESSACNDDLEEEYLRLVKKLNLSNSTYSLTIIEPNLPSCLKYGYRSGTTHMNMQKFSPLTRGYQGPAIAVAAIATSTILKPNCWNESIIDQVIEDGDTYYSESYKNIVTDDRSTLTLLDFKKNFDIRNSHRVFLEIYDPIFAGTFRSDTPKELHVAKALDSFLKKYQAGVLTSSVLNIAIWKDSKHINIFDGQPRTENCEIAEDDDDENATAKLIMVKNLRELLFIILEKSNVHNEPFLLYKIRIVNVEKLSAIPEESHTEAEEPIRRPSGYRIHDKYRAVVQGSFHLHHPILPAEFHGRGHLIIAVAAIIYSKLLSASKWTKAMLDVIFNQSNIYLMDLARVLGKQLDATFHLKINELLCDVILSVYTAKIKVYENVIPGEGKKKKITLISALREYFETHTAGILEMKQVFFALWKENNKYYLFEPFACDEEGFRVDSTDPALADLYEKAASCVTMNSTMEQIVETILENTGSTEKDPFIIHNLRVLYIKTGSKKDGSDETILYRAKKTNRRPRQPTPPPPIEIDDCAPVVIETPVPRLTLTPSVKLQFPEPIDQVEKYVCTFNEEGDEEPEICKRELARCTTGWEIVSCHRLIIRANLNCRNEEFTETSRGRQGLIMALAAFAKAKILEPPKWTSYDVNRMICTANHTYENQVLAWIHGIDEADQEAMEHIPGLEYLDLSMLPNVLNFDGVPITFRWKMNVSEGETNPLANLGEALERFFDQFDEAILENKRLFYGIWLEGKKYYVFNPYGSDKSGWRDNKGPAFLAVVDSIIELVNFLYGLLEFNDYYFAIHYVNVKIQSDENEEPDQTGFASEFDPFEKYTTKFLPVTDDDLNEIKKSAMDDVELDGAGAREGEGEEGSICIKRSRQGLGESGEYEGEEEEESEVVELSDLFEEVEEPEQSDPPERLNLALVTGIVKIQRTSEEVVNFDKILEVFYEKLKYQHPPPFVTPPQKNLCDLLDVKLASKSVNSLVSRFSIDSKLAMKERPDLTQPGLQDAIINYTDFTEKSKLITLPPQKYFFSFSLPSGLTPIRAIDEKYIRNKEIEKEEEEACRKKKLEEGIVMIPGETTDESTSMVLPTIIPLGPCIMTPKYKREVFCPIKKKKKCLLSKKEMEDEILKKIVCSTENLLLELMVPEFKQPISRPLEKCGSLSEPETVDSKKEGCEPTCTEPYGFLPTDDCNIGIINANMSLECRDTTEKEHYKSCYFAAILCILAKINLDVNEFRGSVLDRFIATANKIESGTGKLRLKMMRWFRNFNVLDFRYDVLVKQIRYADPKNYESDKLQCVLKSFLETSKTGILVLDNVALAFWCSDDTYYLFDPYGCDENGRVCTDGYGCLMKMCNYEAFLSRIIENNENSIEKPYRLYAVEITHLEENKKKKKKKKQTKSCKEERPEKKPEDECESDKSEECDSEASLVELMEWLGCGCHKEEPCPNTLPGFVPIKNYKASAIEVEVLENKITRPNLPPLKPEQNDPYIPDRIVPYDRKFQENSALAQPTDLCIMAWSQIYEPIMWSVRTIKALFEASKEYTFNSLFAANDSTIPELWDNILSEFNIANYHFRVVFAPIHVGVLYATEGWNLAMSLNSIFESPIYTGATLCCGTAQIGVMKKKDQYYTWWLVKKTKNMRIIVSDDMEDFLKLIIKQINEPKEETFAIRPVTISYAKMTGPDCSDIEGLHESMMPSTSIPEIHTKNRYGDPFEDVFRPTDKCQTPIHLLGTVALNDRDLVVEPKVKRCYFTAVVAVVLKRDLIQNPLPEMVDKIMELADGLYKLFNKPKYHTEHILKDVSLMNRVFDFRDCASEITKLIDKEGEIIDDFFGIVNQHTRQFFEKCNSGVIHFTNCCYGFWYSDTTRCFYYLDPYQCNSKGKRVDKDGMGCLQIFSNLCDMVKQWCINNYEKTTGFFIHRVHVEAVNPSPYDKFQEDPIWIYLDYHWSYRHASMLKNYKDSSQTCMKSKAKAELKNEDHPDKPLWKNYLIEVPNMIYSLWGTVGAFDAKHGCKTGKNQAAIATVIIALQNLCHPSEWNSTILDSAVIIGGHFYKESKKVHTSYGNKFKLSECLKIFPYFWSIDFATDICGVLYGSKEQPSLAVRLEVAFKKSPSVLLQCGKKILSVIRTSDGYYAIDCSWTGPPLFTKNHGAIYVVRCANVNTLIYVLMKMINTNQKIEFTFTPVKMTFKEEVCQTSESKPKTPKKKLLEKPVYSTPGLTSKHCSLVVGSETVTDEDSYLCYSRNLKLGLEKNIDYETPPELEHLLKHVRTPSKKKKRKICKKASTSVLYKNLKNPRVVDLAKPNAEVCETWSWDRKFEIKTSFVCDETRQMFLAFNDQMKKEVYKTMKHEGGNLRSCVERDEIKKEDQGKSASHVSMAKSSVRISEVHDNASAGNSEEAKSSSELQNDENVNYHKVL